jgi:hypothetical protein
MLRFWNVGFLYVEGENSLKAVGIADPSSILKGTDLEMREENVLKNTFWKK